MPRLQMGRRSAASLKDAHPDYLLAEVLELTHGHRNAQSESAIGIIDRLCELRSRKLRSVDVLGFVQGLEDLSVVQRGINETLADYILETSFAIRDNHLEVKLPVPPA